MLVAIKRKVMDIHNVTSMEFSENKEIQGRVGSIRFCSGRVDLDLISMYFPARSAGEKRKGAQQITEFMNVWLD